jgi:hypothetical protein
MVLLPLQFMRVHSQDFTGVYFGRIISSRNALIMEKKDTIITGYVYVNENEKLILQGTARKKEMTGKIRLTDSTEVTITGTEEKHSFRIQVTTVSGETWVSYLNKLSAKTRYNVPELFTTEFDPLLYGTWESLSDVYPNGKKGTGKSRDEYFKDGRGRTQLLKAPEGVTSSTLHRSGPFPILDFVWQSKGETLSVTWTAANRGFSGTYRYSIRGDTLVIVDRGIVSSFKRQ